MKLQTKDIAGFLQKPPPDILAALLYGPDHGLIMQRGRQLAQALLGAGHDPMNLVELSEERLKADPPLLRDEMSAMSLLGGGGPRVVMLRDATDKSADIIGETMAGLNPTATLIVLSEDLGPSSSLRQLFEKGKELAALPCYRDDGRTLEAVIAERLRTAGVQTGSDVIRFLAAHEGADRQVTLQEMDKIALYLGNEKRLTMEVAERLAGQNNYLSQDDLCMAAADGNVAQLEACLQRSLAEGVSAVAIVRALQRYFQRLFVLHGALAQGEPLETAIAKLRPPVFFKYLAPLKSHVRRWPAADVRRALSKLIAIERDLKTSSLPAALQLSHALLALALLPAQKQAA